MANPPGEWRTRLESQLAYYRARAAEYDQWFLRQGRYDRGPEENQRWFRELDVVRRALAEGHPGGEILELAAGTGIWSRELLPEADSLTVVDGAEEMLAIHARRVEDPRVTRICADIFEWTPPRSFDLVAFGFWLSHVPRELFVDFFDLVDSALAPGGRFFFVDSRYARTSTAKDHDLAPAEDEVQRRRLNDGREFDIVKRFPEPRELTDDLRRLGWSTEIAATETFFLYGWGRRSV